MLKIRVFVYAAKSSLDQDAPLHMYQVDHDDPTQRRVLGAQCRAAFEAGQTIVTRPMGNAAESLQR